MVNTVGINNIEPLTTDISKKFEFFLNIHLEKDIARISKINSVMCTPSNIILEKSNTGILATITYNLKIIYIEENNETLHVWKSSYTHITDIKTSEKIGWDSITALIKRKKLYPKVQIYEIFADKIDPKTFFIKVYCFLIIDYAKPLDICLNIETDQTNSNLFLANEDLKSLEQITFNPVGKIKNAVFDKILPTLYFIKEIGSTYSLESFNLKTKSFTTLINDFLSITNFKVFNQFILVYGETAFTNGIFKVDKKTLEIDVLSQALDPIDFSYINNGLYLLEKNTDTVTLDYISEDLLNESDSLPLDVIHALFIDNYLLYLDQNTNLMLLNLKTKGTLILLKNSSFTHLNKALLSDLDIYIHFNIGKTDSGIISYNLETKKLQYLLNKKVHITSITLIKEKKEIYFTFKTKDFIELYKLKKHKISRVLKLSATNILLTNKD